MQIQTAIDAYVRQLCGDGRSAHTTRQARRHLAKLAAWLAADGVTDLEDIQPDHLARFMTSDGVRLTARGTPRKATSANCLRSTLRTFCVYARDAGLVSGNAARVLRRARCSPPLPKALSEAEEARLLAALDAARTPADRRDRALVYLLLRAGVRIGSAIGARVEDLDLDAAQLLLRCMKNGGEHIVYLHPRLVEELRGYVGSRASGALFAIGSRQTNRRLSQWGDRAGIAGLAAHRLRHTCAQRLLDATHDLSLVQQVLGHASIASTTNYVRSSPTRVRAAVLAQ